MKIADAIGNVKKFCQGIDAWTGAPIDDATTHDKVTYGREHLEEECTGIVCCLWATADAIRIAKASGANLIICHEALFWNHGDRQEVLSGNKVFAAKRELLDTWGVSSGAAITTSTPACPSMMEDTQMASSSALRRRWDGWTFVSETSLPAWTI